MNGRRDRCQVVELVRSTYDIPEWRIISRDSRNSTQDVQRATISSHSRVETATSRVHGDSCIRTKVSIREAVCLQVLFRRVRDGIRELNARVIKIQADTYHSKESLYRATEAVVRAKFDIFQSRSQSRAF